MKIERGFRRVWKNARRLTYARAECDCGARFAYLRRSRARAWDCSDILLDVAIPSGGEGAKMHSDTMPFVFWKVESDNSYKPDRAELRVKYDRLFKG